jgi:tetratricopeptide (TPR) repeat protein
MVVKFLARGGYLFPRPPPPPSPASDGLDNRGDFEKGRDYYEQTLEIRKTKIQFKSVDVGNLHYKKGELEKAKEYYDRAFEIGKEELGLNSDDVADCSDNFGRMCDGACDLKKGRFYYDRIRRKTF